jgi:hypothetical protein
MDTLQQLFDSILEKHIKTVQGDVLRKKFGKLGIELRDEQVTEILQKSIDGTISIELDDGQLLGSKIALPGGFPNEIQIEFSEAEADELVNKFSSSLSEAIPAMVESSAEVFLKELRRKLSSRVKAGVKDRRWFEKRRVKVWQKPFELFEFFLSVVIEVGAEFNDHYRETAAKEGDLVFEVLTRLHARACRIGSEVMALMRSGFADGAHARWRTLHEIAVVSIFISKHGKQVAERYLDHEIVESYKSAVQHQKHCEALRCPPIPQEEFEQIKIEYENAVKRYGSAFKTDYGWASSILRKERPFITDIEANVELEKWRPYYKMASRTVHANVKGITKSLGLPPGEGHILFAGASDIGFADPAHGAAISLLQITTTLLTSKPNVDALIRSSVLRTLEKEIGEEFLKTHELCERNYSPDELEDDLL